LEVLRFGFSVGDVLMEECFRLFEQIYLALGPNPRGNIFGWSFCGTLATICVFRVLDWLSSTSGDKKYGSKIQFMKKPNFTRQVWFVLFL